ncbi:MAG TPA: hypothetical protein VGN07_10830 [Steroidobacteraceae bacterium]|jgi:hypothetical protein
MNSEAARQVGDAAIARTVIGAAVALGLLGAGGVSAATLQEGGGAVRNGNIGYVLTHKVWSLYETAGAKTECPQGFNDGPREQFKQQYNDGKKRTIVEAQLKREAEEWHPSTTPEQFTFKEAQGNTSYGMNLDGKIGPNDFVSPDGQKGIDNQLYRVIGCISNYRTMGTINHFEELFMRSYNDARVVIELSGVDNLVNDNDVTVHFYRGSDGLLQDATGEGFIPGGTQNVDMRWGKEYIAQAKGKIVDGVLTSEPIDTVRLPWMSTFGTSAYHVFRGLRVNLKVSQTGAEGMLAGYVDVDAFMHQLTTSWSTHHQSYGQLSSPSEYRALRRLADGYPDPKTGENTAISSSVNVKFVQVFVQHPESRQITAKK